VPASGGGPGALLVSPFNMKWRCSAQAGGVEGSKFCLFLVVFPVRCISSVSPRFYFRRHVFCSLPLATILESPYFSSISFQFLQKLSMCLIFLIALEIPIQFIVLSNRTQFDLVANVSV
jgi:hypothetical protein